ncbi:hypothetical protein B0H14DRAFT_3146390 [Mycena olivaceomarginata]|nr:hypothetical protein B0H14DRAFT_3146390 [Mycena olivaceomarginata]
MTFTHRWKCQYKGIKPRKFYASHTVRIPGQLSIFAQSKSHRTSQPVPIQGTRRVKVFGLKKPALPVPNSVWYFDPGDGDRTWTLGAFCSDGFQLVELIDPLSALLQAVEVHEGHIENTSSSSTAVNIREGTQARRGLKWMQDAWKSWRKGWARVNYERRSQKVDRDTLASNWIRKMRKTYQDRVLDAPVCSQSPTKIVRMIDPGVARGTPEILYAEYESGVELYIRGPHLSRGNNSAGLLEVALAYLNCILFNEEAEMERFEDRGDERDERGEQDSGANLSVLSNLWNVLRSCSAEKGLCVQVFGLSGFERDLRRDLRFDEQERAGAQDLTVARVLPRRLTDGRIGLEVRY